MKNSSTEGKKKGTFVISKTYIDPCSHVVWTEWSEPFFGSMNTGIWTNRYERVVIQKRNCAQCNLEQRRKV